MIVRFLQRFEGMEAVDLETGGEKRRGLEALDPEGRIRYQSNLAVAPKDPAIVKIKVVRGD